MILICPLGVHMPSISGIQEGSKVAQWPARELLISSVIFRNWQLIGHTVIVEVAVVAEQAVTFLHYFCPLILPFSQSTSVDIYLLSRTELGHRWRSHQNRTVSLPLWRLKTNGSDKHWIIVPIKRVITKMTLLWFPFWILSFVSN